ncbi:MAG: Ig-like domain-containing protein, partial [Deltaproteobacteria bacterium]|nr:Ig-like domain-containing protein [Deltaproteobacteria bacterium]
RFPAATEYSCTVPGGTAALDGTALEAAVSWSFSTEAPALERSWPRHGEEAWELDKPIVLRFNQAVEPSAIQPFLRLATGAGQVVGVTASAAAGEHAEPDTVELAARLERDTAYTLTVAAGLRGAEGPIALATDAAISFHTTPRAGVAEYGPQGDGGDTGVDPESSIRIVFNTEIDGKKAAEKIQISPAPPDGWRPAESYTSRYWYYNPRLKPRTTYTVTVKAGVEDIHGQKTADDYTWSFTTGDLEPLLDAPWAASQLYPANNPPTVPVRFRNVSRVEAEFERIDPALILGGRVEFRDLLDDEGGRRVAVESPAERNVLHRAMLSMAPELDGGHGIVRLSTWSPEVLGWEGLPERRTAIFQVTDLGANLKLTPDGATVWVTRLADGAPVPGAAVELWRSGRKLWSGTADNDGVALARGDFIADGEYEWGGDEVLAAVRNGTDLAIVGHQTREGLEPWRAGAWAAFDADGRQVEIVAFTDRGVYRPGDTAHVAVTARVADMQGLGAAGGAVSWSVSDPDGAAAASGTCTLSAGGTCTFDVETPADARLGDWSVQLEGDDGASRASVSIPVRAYRAPAFRVDVAGPERLVAGETLSAKADARYLFGAPMKGAKAKWSVRRAVRQPKFADFDGYHFAVLPTDDLWSAPAAVEDAVSSGNAVVDADGQFTVSQVLPVDQVSRPYTYLIEATVTDTDRQQVSGRATVEVDSASVYPAVKPEGWLAEANKPTRVLVTAVSPEGKLVPRANVRTTLLRRTWDNIRERGVDGTWRWVTNKKDEVVTTGTVSAGVGSSWSFTPEAGGYYIVRAECTDKSGRGATAEAGIWVFGGDVSWARSDDHQLELVPDRLRYEPGDTARILVKGPKRGLRALVTVEREGIWSRRVVTLDSTSATLTVPITDEMAPNAFVSVVAAEGAPPADKPGAGVPGVWYGLVNLAVSPDAQRVDVELSTDKGSYQPRDEVTVTVTASREDKPLADAHVVLWAVDYGVLSLTAYETPDLHQRFYTPRDLGVITADNRVSVYDRALRLAKGAEIGGGGGGDPATRSNFVTTPLWEGTLRTGADGTLTHRFPLPDNLTTFRVMAVVDDGRAGFGKDEAELRVNRPLIARPALPRFFRGGDRALAGVVLHNNTPTPLDVAVNATVEGATLRGAPRTVRVEPDAATEVPFALTDFTGERVSFHFDAEAGDHADAVDLAVPVAYARPTEVVASAGSTTGSTTVDVLVPEDVLRESGGLDVQVSASSLVGIGRSIDYVIDYPHGCLEQTVSRARVALLAGRVRDQAGISRSAADLVALSQAGLAKLADFRTYSGGYAYWPGGYRPDPLATAYALEFLAEAKRAGLEIDAEAQKGAVTILREVLAGKHLPTWIGEEGAHAIQARAALSLARAGQPDPAFNNRLLGDAAGRTALTRAQLLETVARTNVRDPRVVSLQRDLEASLHVEATTAALVDPDRDKLAALWWGEDVATIELVRALNVAAPAHPLMERLVAYVVQSRRQGRWSNTWATAEGLAALADYAARAESGAPSAKVSLGGGALIDQVLGAGGQAQAQVAMNLLKSGPLAFEANGGRLYYESRLSYARPVLPPRDEGFTVERKLELVGGGGTANGRVEPGSLVRVTLRVVTPVDRYHVALVDALPAGLEPVDTSFATEASDLGGGGRDTGTRGRDTGEDTESPHWWSAWVFNRQELGDSEVKWFADYMPRGIHAQSYIARATTPGSYAHPAAIAQAMYAPDVYGRTEAGRFVVGQAVARR